MTALSAPYRAWRTVGNALRLTVHAARPAVTHDGDGCERAQPARVGARPSFELLAPAHLPTPHLTCSPWCPVRMLALKWGPKGREVMAGSRAGGPA